MQKVAKEILELREKGKYVTPEASDKQLDESALPFTTSNTDYTNANLIKLLSLRELSLFNKLKDTTA